jgi:1-acyl-sn-glycerol-3-phosphate acyltransferase
MSTKQSAITPPDADTGLWAWLRSPLPTIWLMGGLLYWLIGGILFNVVAWILLFILPRPAGRVVGCKLIRAGFRFFCTYLRWTRLVDFDLSSLDRLRRTRESFILAPNHTALWDAVFIITCLPAPLCIMKTTILYNPLLGGCARLAGHIPNRSRAGTIRAAVKGLRHGGQLILFPEGTRTRHHERWTNPFKGGVAAVAKVAEVPVYPVFVRSDTRYLQKGWPPWKRPSFPIHIEFELGEPVSVQPDESSHDFVERLERLFEDELSRPHPLRRQAEADAAT